MATILPLVFHPDSKLRERSIEIPTADISTLKALVADMALTMEEDKGIGLAAPQIGKNIRLIIVNTKSGIQAMINPKLIKTSLRQEWGEEGCLSIPNVFGDVKRHRSVECTFLDLEGHEQVVKASGLLARVIQHEIDHLDGILFIDKAKHIREEN